MPDPGSRPPPPASPVPALPPRRAAYAALSRRAVAFFLDFMVVLVLCISLLAFAMQVRGEPPGTVFLILLAAYFGLLPATRLQATPGKRALGIRIADREGKRIGLGRSLLRFVLFVPSAGIAFAGFVLAAFTPRRQALHDLGAGTIVVDAHATPGEVLQAPAPMSWANRIGLALAIGIAALTLHTFMQVYDDRRTREHTMALVANVQPYQVDVVRALQARAPMPVAQKLPRHARTMSARPDGTIVVEVSDDLLPGSRLILRPSTNAKGEPMWTCRWENARPALLPAWCRP